MTIYDFVELFFSIICFWNKFSVTLQQISSKWNKKVKSEKWNVESEEFNNPLASQPHFQTFNLSLNTWTLSHIQSCTKKEFALTYSPLPTHAQTRRNGLSSRRQSKGRASGAIVFSHPKWQHAIINNHKPPSKELKHKQQRLKDEPTLKSKACLKCLYFTKRLLLATPTRPSKTSQSRAPECDGESLGTTKSVGVTLKTKTLKPIS